MFATQYAKLNQRTEPRFTQKNILYIDRAVNHSFHLISATITFSKRVYAPKFDVSEVNLAFIAARKLETVAKGTNSLSIETFLLTLNYKERS